MYTFFVVFETIDYVVAPETALDNSIWLNNLEANYSINAIRNFVNKNPNVNFITGIDCYKRYMPEEELSLTARYLEQEKFYYDAYNSAIQIDTSNFIPIYHKSKLVVGVEKMPYPKLFKFLNFKFKKTSHIFIRSNLLIFLYSFRFFQFTLSLLRNASNKTKLMRV